MNTEDIVKETLRVLDAAAVPIELRPSAFPAVLQLVSGQASPSEFSSQLGESRESTGGTGLQKVASKLGLSEDVVGRVFYEVDGEIGLGVSAARLDQSVARATKQIALLVAAGRQGAGIDDGWTSTGVIRETCRDFRKLDAPNFASAITEMDDAFVFRGKGQNRVVRVAQPGWSKVAELVERLAG